MPVGRGGVINSPFFSMSETGLPLKGDTAHLQAHEYIVKSFPAECVNKTRILPYILKYLNDNVLRAHPKYCRFCRYNTTFELIFWQNITTKQTF